MSRITVMYVFTRVYIVESRNFQHCHLVSHSLIEPNIYPLLNQYITKNHSATQSISSLTRKFTRLAGARYNLNPFYHRQIHRVRNRCRAGNRPTNLHLLLLLPSPSPQTRKLFDSSGNCVEIPDSQHLTGSTCPPFSCSTRFCARFSMKPACICVNRGSYREKSILWSNLVELIGISRKIVVSLIFKNKKFTCASS